MYKIYIFVNGRKYATGDVFYTKKSAERFTRRMNSKPVEERDWHYFIEAV